MSASLRVSCLPGGAPVVPSTPETAVKVSGLRKSFGSQVVLDGIDFEVAEGTVFALLGPNGAGKTTTVHVLTTLWPADGGHGEVAGFDLARRPEAVRAAIGVTGQFSAVDPLLTGEENLLLMADLHHLGRGERRRRTSDLLERFDLVDSAGKLATTYSGGMRRRLDLAMTLIGAPRLVFLDEPTTGLDPRSRRTMWAIVGELKAEGVTIFLTTQDLSEADRLADRVALLDHGRIVAEGTPAELKRQIPGSYAEVTFASLDDLNRAAGVFGAAARDDDALTLQVPTDDTPRSILAVLDQLAGSGVAGDRVSVHTPDLDDVFFAFTNPTTTHRSLT